MNGANGASGVIPRSEDGYEACPAPNGDGWQSIEPGDHPTGTIKIPEGSLTYPVKQASWRSGDEPNTWLVSLDTEMENGTPKRLQNGSWNYNYLIVAQRRNELIDGGCYSAVPAYVEPGLKGDARAGFVVPCKPVGAIELVMGGDEQVGEDAATIAVSRDTQPGDCSQ